MSEISEIIDRFKSAMDAEEDNRRLALEADKFCNLEQWPDEVKSARENDPDGARPCLTIDKINQYVKQVCNDQRQNRPQIKVRPVDDYADIETAKVLNGIIRHIENNSRADIAYDRAFEQACRGGFGYWRILTEYTDPKSFDQDIVIKSIKNRFSVYLDPSHQEPDGSDIDWGFITERMRKDDYKNKYKGKDSEWQEAGLGDQKSFWYEENFARVAEYFCIEHKAEKLLLLNDGTIALEIEYLSEPGEKNYRPDVWMNGKRKEVSRDRMTNMRQVKWKKVSGARVLDERDWPGIYIPIVKMIGNEIDIEGESHLSGMVRPAMDSGRMYNYAVSSFVEMVALAPKAPWLAASGQIEGHEDEWAAANRRNLSVLPYKPVNQDGVLVPPPQRQPMPGIPAGWAQAMSAFDNDIQGNMGMYKAAIGAPSPETSGRAILAKARESDTSNFNYVDNLTRSMIHSGRILVDLIPHYYKDRKTARILGEDGSTEFANLNSAQNESYIERQSLDGKKKKYFNIGMGKYDVTITVGPAFATRRQESAEAMLQATQAYPQLMGLAGDIMFRNMDWPGAEEVYDRLKKTIPPELMGDDDDPENAQVMQLGQALQEAQGQLQAMAQEMEMMQKAKADESQIKAMEMQIKGREQDIKEMEVSLKARETAIKEQEAQIKAYDAETKRITAVSSAETKQEVQPQSINVYDKDVFGGMQESMSSMTQGVAQTNAEIAGAINSLAQAIAQPKTVVRDSDGRPIGIQ